LYLTLSDTMIKLRPQLNLKRKLLF